MGAACSQRCGVLDPAQDGSVSRHRRPVVGDTVSTLQGSADGQTEFVPPSERECKVCCNKKTMEHFAGGITGQCNHTRDVCKECVACTIDLEVDGKGNATEVRCPRAGCTAILSYDDIRREATSELLEQEGTVRCPSCSHGIEKKGGCDHMTCRREASGCGYEFCFRCLADYNTILKDGNHKHKEGCPHFRAFTGSGS